MAGLSKRDKRTNTEDDLAAAGWEVFTKARRVQRRLPPVVRVMADGVLVFSRSVRRQPDETVATFMSLYYRPKDRVIAFRFTKEREPSSYRLWVTGGFAGRGFFDYYGIDPKNLFRKGLDGVGVELHRG